MADDSILDYLSNNWSQLLGINQPQGGGPMAGQPAAPPQGGGPMAGTPPLPPASAMANNGQFSPNTVQGGPLLSAADQGAALGIPPSAVVQPGGYGATGGGPNANLPMPIPGGPGSAAAAINPNVVPPPNLNLPLPQPRPPGAPGMPPQGGGPMAGIPTSTGPATPGPPMNILPPPASAMQKPPPYQTLGSLAAALGYKPQPPNPWAGFAAGVGRGLTAVGNARPGASGAQMFAAGAGGGLTGSTEFIDKQGKEFFDQTVAGNNAAMKELAFPHNIAHLDAATQYMLGKNGVGPAAGPNSRAWQLSDTYRLQEAEKETDEWEKNQERQLEAQSKVYDSLGKNKQPLLDRYDQLEQQKEKQRQLNYKRWNVNPQTAKGTEANPIDATNMTSQQIATMPDGAYWYGKGDDPKNPRIRNYAITPNPETQAAQQQQQPQTAQDYATTQAALSAGGPTGMIQ